MGFAKKNIINIILKNSKIEFLYPVITGTVGKITQVEEITEFIEGENEYVYKIFSQSSSGNYLYYDFVRWPIGNIASLRIKTDSTKVNKVVCTLVSPSASDETMVAAVNVAALQGTSICIGEMGRYGDEYDALIKANLFEGKSRLVIQVLYGLEEERDKETIFLSLFSKS